MSERASLTVVVIGRSPLVVAMVCMAVLWLLLPSGAGAGMCGGGVPCECGDTVAADHSLSASLGPCPGHGLLIGNRVRLDCHGHTVRGLADGSEQYGIYLRGRAGAEMSGITVQNCEVTGFHRGIRLTAASGNTLVNNVVRDNGNVKTHVGYGIDLAGRSRNNTLRSNRVYRNADEGIHIGQGGHDNRLVDNVVTDNYREDVYVLESNGGRFTGNTVGGGGANSIYLKDSSFNFIERNTFRKSTARIIGDSHDNRLLNNTFVGAGLHFECHKGSGRCPFKNQVTGGSIEGASECLRFTGSYGNIVTDTLLSKCSVDVRAESAGRPSANTIIGHDPARIALDNNSTLHVGYRLNVRVEDESGMPLSGVEIHVTNASGTRVFSGLTDETGTLSEQTLITRTRTGHGVLPGDSYSLGTSRAGYVSHERTVAVTQHLRLTIVLKRE